MLANGSACTAHWLRPWVTAQPWSLGQCGPSRLPSFPAPPKEYWLTRPQTCWLGKAGWRGPTSDRKEGYEDWKCLPVFVLWIEYANSFSELCKLCFRGFGIKGRKPALSLSNSQKGLKSSPCFCPIVWKDWNPDSDFLLSERDEIQPVLPSAATEILSDLLPFTQSSQSFCSLWLPGLLLLCAVLCFLLSQLVEAAMEHPGGLLASFLLWGTAQH